jgi:Putative MetA-pathway of phenol degradation
MVRKSVRMLVATAVLVVAGSSAWAAHPLITDDPETQGTGKFQLEVNGEWATDKENSVVGTTRETGTQAAAIFSAGVRENIDLVLTTPYQWVEVRDPAGRAREDGVGDTVFEIKWRFFERSGWSFGLKPGVIIPTGNDEKGLGAGKVGYSASLISQSEHEPWEFLVNLGYVRNENRLDERQDLWHASLAVEYEIVERLELVGDIGIGTNTDKGPATDPAFLIVGLIYELSESVDFALGVKYGLNKPETDLTVLPGVTVRF